RGMAQAVSGKAMAGEDFEKGERMKDFIIYTDYEKVGIYPSITTAGRDLKDEMNLRVHDKSMGYDFEFMVKLINLGQTTTSGAQKLSLKVEIFGDAFQAFTACKEVFETLIRYSEGSSQWVEPDTLEKLSKDLVAVGWKRKMPEKKEILKRKPSCPTCGHEVKKRILA